MLFEKLNQTLTLTLGKTQPFYTISFSHTSSKRVKIFMILSPNLKKLSSKCEFDNPQDSLIKDMVVYGTRDNYLRERFLQEFNLTLSKAISAGHDAEETYKHAHKISDLNLPLTLIRYLKGN